MADTVTRVLEITTRSIERATDPSDGQERLRVVFEIRTPDGHSFDWPIWAPMGEQNAAKAESVAWAELHRISSKIAQRSEMHARAEGDKPS